MRPLIKKWITKRVAGPSPESREKSKSSLWGRVENTAGQVVRGTLTTPNGYTLTVMTALAAVERLLQSPPCAGFLTPSLAFGADFITKFSGCDLRV